MFVSMFSIVAEDVLRSSPMVVLSSFDPHHFDSQILRLSTFVVAALESTILPMYFDFVFHLTDIFR